MKDTDKVERNVEEGDSATGKENVKTIEGFFAKLFGFTNAPHDLCISSFVGGLAFGAGLSLVVTKTLRALFLSASGGICLLMQKRYYHITTGVTYSKWPKSMTNPSVFAHYGELSQEWKRW